MGTDEDQQVEAEMRALARRWPRELIQSGEAAALAAHWVTSRRTAQAAGLPPFARGTLTPALATALFEARRARRIVRGLEEIELALEAQAQGIVAAPGRDRPGTPDRISRLLVISEDGADRFYRKIASLVRKYGKLLEVYVCACDERILGGAVFGAGRRARALLVDHKQSVVEVLRAVVDAA